MRTAALLSLFFAVNLASAQDSDTSSLTTALNEATNRASRGSIEEVWLEAHLLSELSLDFEGVNFDALVDSALSRTEASTEQLFLMALRLEGEDVPATNLSQRLHAISESQSEELRLAALSLLQRPEFRAADPDEMEKVVTSLLRRAANADTAPMERMEFAVTAYIRG